MFSWSLPGGVVVRYSTVDDGDLAGCDHRQAFTRACLGRRPLACLHQEHGTRIRSVDGPPPPGTRGDGLVTTRNDLALGVFGADCPGLVVVAAGVLAVAHCGWRGTAAGIVGRLLAMVGRHCRQPPSAWSALVGPGISGSRYEVDRPVLDAGSWHPAVLRPGRPGHWWLDVPGQVAHECRRCGVGRVETSGVCTATEPRLHSYRHQGPGPSQLLVAWYQAAV